jgi:hypothetical protein
MSMRRMNEYEKNKYEKNERMRKNEEDEGMKRWGREGE